VVGAAVDDDDLGRQGCGDRPARTVRQGQDHDVVPGEGLRRGLLEHPVGQRHEVGMVLAEAGAGTGRRGDGADRELGVAEREAEDLTTGVAAGSRHRDRRHDA
jgi:hypothetical protein